MLHERSKVRGDGHRIEAQGFPCVISEQVGARLRFQGLNPTPRVPWKAVLVVVVTSPYRRGSRLHCLHQVRCAVHAEPLASSAKVVPHPRAAVGPVAECEALADAARQPCVLLGPGARLTAQPLVGPALRHP